MNKRKKILLIDDFYPLLEEISEFLAMEGYQVITANDGAEGVQKAVQYTPDLIICDIEMPNMNGHEVFKAIDSIPSTKGTPFIFATARAQVDDFRLGLKLGVDDYITKPFELEELIMSIQKRFEKIERIKADSENKFNSLTQSPLSGVFYYQENRFLMFNKKMEEIIGYSLQEMNQLRPEELIVGDSKKIINTICLCVNGVHATTQLKFTIYDKEKKLHFIEFFCKNIETEGKKGIIATVAENNSTQKNNQTTTNTDIQELIQYLVATDKEHIAKEIVQAQELITYEKDAKNSYTKEHMRLSKRELEILSLICKGYTNNEIADQLFISPRTVDNHRSNLLQKTGAKNTATLVAYAISRKIIIL